jgi:hypothetical protein
MFRRAGPVPVPTVVADERKFFHLKIDTTRSFALISKVQPIHKPPRYEQQGKKCMPILLCFTGQLTCLVTAAATNFVSGRGIVKRPLKLDIASSSYTAFLVTRDLVQIDDTRLPEAEWDAQLFRSV